MNDLERYFRTNEDRRSIAKYFHYFDIYEFFFSKFRGKEATVLEIGLGEGGSLQMWKYYFGSKAIIYSIDKNKSTEYLDEEDKDKFFCGLQEDREFLKDVKSKILLLDIILDDASHRSQDQIVSLEELWEHLKIGGLYLIEDLSQAYIEGYKNPSNFIEYAKDLIDYIYGYFEANRGEKTRELIKTLTSIHFYYGIIVFEKGKAYDYRSPIKIGRDIEGKKYDYGVPYKIC